MKHNDNNVEELFQSAFDGYKVQPSEQAWENLQRKMRWKEFFRFNLVHFNVFYFSFFLIAGLSAFIFMEPFQNQTTNNLLPEKTVSEKQIVSQNPQDLPARRQLNSSEETVHNMPETNALPAQTETTSTITTQNQTHENSGALLTQRGTPVSDASLQNESPDNQLSTTNIANNETGENNIINETEPCKAPEALFTPSVSEGCAPLTVSFANKSLKASTYVWNFGDGNFSTASNPIHTYTAPGTYEVVLRANGKGGSDFNNTYRITVFERPVAKAHVESKIDNTNAPVFFNNESENATYYEWDFDDNNYSSEREPVHYFASNQVFDVTLKVWSEHHCIDSAIIPNVLNVSAPVAGKLIFPNAFTPSTNGANGGYYSFTDRTNDVFYPLHYGVAEYKLQIFNRFGALVFETTDIQQGWDGYYDNGRLAVEDAYVWRATGRYENGQAFTKVGNVTLIYSDNNR